MGVIQKLSTIPFCTLRDTKDDVVFSPDSELYLKSRASKPQTLEALIQITNEIRDLQQKQHDLNANERHLTVQKETVLVPDALRTKYSVDPRIAIDQEMENLEVKISEFNRDVQARSREINSCVDDRLSGQVFSANMSRLWLGVQSPTEILRNSLLQNCREHPPIKINTVDENKIESICELPKTSPKECQNLKATKPKSFVIRGLVDADLQTRREALLNRIQLGSQPVGISLAVFDLIHQHKGLAKTSNHEILVIGKRQVGKACQVLVRNSWGACDPKAKVSAEFPGSICDTDGFWMDVDVLAAKITGVFQFPK